MTNQSPLSLAYFGSPKFSVPILDALAQHHQIKLVISQPDKPAGHGLHPTPSAVSAYATAHHLPLLTPAKLNQPDIKAHLLATPVDLAVVAAFGKILPQWLLDWPTYGCINIHTSLLPAYRGASPITAALLDGLSATGITYIKMDAGLDTGPIIHQTKVQIDPEETGDSLYIKMSHTASKGINLVLNDYIKNPANLTPQDHNQASHTTLISKQDGYIDLNQPPANLKQRIYAYHSWPGVWTNFHGKRVKFLPGGLVQMEGKKPTSLPSFRHGYPDFPLLSLD